MPYEALCVECGHFLYGVIRTETDRAILRHCVQKHGRGIRYRIRKISRARFLAHLAFKEDHRYWDALRNARGPAG